MPILLGNLDLILPNLVSSLKPALYCTTALVRVRGQGHYSLVQLERCSLVQVHYSLAVEQYNLVGLLGQEHCSWVQVRGHCSLLVEHCS